MAEPKKSSESSLKEIDNWGTLCKRLRVSRTAVYEWKKLPGAPTEPDYEAWKLFVEENELGISGNRTDRGREELLKENLTKKNRLLDLQIAKEEKTVVDRSEVNELLLHVSTLAKAILYPAMERELPPRAEGRSAAEISIVGREVADRICEQMQSDLAVWAES